MRRTIETTLEELGCRASHDLDVEIEYAFSEGEKTVMNPPDKAYPGSPPMVELDDVLVTAWNVGEEEPRARDLSWIWAELDILATAEVNKFWESIYSDLCLEDAADNYYERRV